MAPRAIEVLRQASFRSHGMKVELFSESDFDRDIHAVAMSRAGLSRAIDLHWRALFWLDDEPPDAEQETRRGLQHQSSQMRRLHDDSREAVG